MFDEYRALGDVSLEYFKGDLARVNSPMLPVAEALYYTVRGHSVRALAHMWRESRHETDRMLLSPQDNNPFNLRPNYINGVLEEPPGFTGVKHDYLTFSSYVSCAREFMRRTTTDPTYKGGVYTRVHTLEDYCNTYAPVGDAHPVTDDANETYADDMVTIITRFLAANPATSPPVEESPMATHRYILSAGHRNENGGGARNEINWTYPSVKALKAAIEARGGKAFIVHELDGDGDNSFSHDRGLQNVAALCVQLAKTHGPFDAYISSHYNGGASPGFHAIFPDAWSGVDIKANNPLDVRLARTMRDRVKATNTVRMLSWTRDSPGVMSERETGVGAQGYRLGEFVGTLGFRDTTARVIIEASSIDVASEARYINDPNWVRNVYSEAIVDALEDVFGDFREGPEPPPTTTYAEKSPIAALVDLPAYHEVFSQGQRIAQLVRANFTVKVAKQTKALRYAGGSATVRADFMPDELVDVDYLIINTDDTMYWYTADGIRFRFDDALPYFPDVDEGETP